MFSLTPYPITPIGCFLGVVLAVVPLPLHLARRNHGVFMYGAWLAAYNFQMFVNTVIWHDNTDVKAEVWCDITTKIEIGTGYAVRGCSLAICIRLYRLTRMRAEFSRGPKWVALDWFLTLIMPCIFMGLWVIIQAVRFDIFEEYGCMTVPFSYVIYITAFAPQLVMSIVSFILAFVVIRFVMTHRKEVNEHLATSDAITPSRYKRLMLIALLDTISNLPIMLGGLLQDALIGSAGLTNRPYISWANVHDGAGGAFPRDSLSTTLQTPASEWSKDTWTVVNVKWNEWIYVFQAVIYFAVVGTTPELGRAVRRVFCLFSGRSSSGNRSSEDGAGRTMSTVIFRSPATSGPTSVTAGGARSISDGRPMTVSFHEVDLPDKDGLNSSDSVNSEEPSIMKVEELAVESEPTNDNSSSDSSAIDLEKGI